MASKTTSTSKKAKVGAKTLPKTGREASRKPKPRGRAKAEVLTETKVPSNAEAPLEDVVPATADEELELLPDVAAVADTDDFGPEATMEEPVEAASESEDDMRLEDVDEVVARKASKDDEAQSFLAMYFKNMAELDVLKPEQEFESAREIEALEIELWTMLLGYLPGAGQVANVVERTIGKPFEPFEEYRALVAKQVKGKAPAANKKRLDALVEEMSGKLRELDIEK
jgi:hypothetical protein